MIEWPSCVEFKPEGNFLTFANKPLSGLPVAVIGGGPSLTPMWVRALGQFPCICVNNAFMLMDRPQMVVALDKRWWDWHGRQVEKCGHLPVGAILGPGGYPHPNVRNLHRDKVNEFDPEFRGLCGKNSGHAAIHAAWHLGASRIYLAGFDMGFRRGRSHWHEPHRVPASEANYELRFRPMLETLVSSMSKTGVIVRAITPSLADIPHMPLAEALTDLEKHHAPHRVDHSEASAPVSE